MLITPHTMRHHACSIDHLRMPGRLILHLLAAMSSEADVAAVVASLTRHPSLRQVLLPSLDGHRRWAGCQNAGLLLFASCSWPAGGWTMCCCSCWTGTAGGPVFRMQIVAACGFGTPAGAAPGAATFAGWAPQVSQCC